VSKKPCPQNVTLRIPLEVEEKILRRTYPFGPLRGT